MTCSKGPGLELNTVRRSKNLIHGMSSIKFFLRHIWQPHFTPTWTPLFLFYFFILLSWVYCLDVGVQRRIIHVLCLFSCLILAISDLDSLQLTLNTLFLTSLQHLSSVHLFVPKNRKARCWICLRGCLGRCRQDDLSVLHRTEGKL